MTYLLLSFFDAKDRNAALTQGRKVELARKMTGLLAAGDLDARSLYCEVALLQPSWLAASVSTGLLLPDSAPSLTDLVQKMKGLDVKEDRTELMLETSLHRIVAATQAHTLYRYRA